MFCQTKTFVAPLLFCLVYLACAIQAQAGPITITITNPVQTLEYPNTIVFRGTITNTTAQDVHIGFLGLGSSNTSNPGIIFILDPGILVPFQTAELIFPAFSSTGEIPLFSASVSQFLIHGQFPFTYEGYIEMGRLNDPVLSFNARAGYSITVPHGASAVPEPATLLLLGTGLAGVAASTRKRWKQDRS